MKPICIDLFCGLGGWSQGFLAEGYRCVGFDIERHDYGNGGYPGELVLQDILTIHGSQFKDAACIVASPPCQRYSYMAMPWSRAKALIAWHKESPERIKELNALFDACFRIQIEASKTAGRYIPLVVENVKGAQPWVGRAKWHYGSFYLWGDVPALMPTTNGRRMKFPADCGPRMWSDREVVRLNDGTQQTFHLKGIPHAPIGHWTNPAENGGTKQGGDWFSTEGSISRTTGGRSDARKAASAQIAMIPFPLSQHIARCFKP